jgi:hypothetical protein
MENPTCFWSRPNFEIEHVFVCDAWYELVLVVVKWFFGPVLELSLGFVSFVVLGFVVGFVLGIIEEILVLWVIVCG